VEAAGFGIFMVNAVLSGRGDEIIDPAKVNLFRWPGLIAMLRATRRCYRVKAVDVLATAPRPPEQR